MAIEKTVIPMTEVEARTCVEAIRRDLNNLRALIFDLKERRGWEALGYRSWRECVVAEFEQSQAHLYRQLEAAKIEQELSPKGEIGAIPEGTLRPLKGLSDPTRRREAWDRARAVAPDGRPTAKQVEVAVRAIASESGPSPLARPAMAASKPGTPAAIHLPTGTCEGVSEAILSQYNGSQCALIVAKVMEHLDGKMIDELMAECRAETSKPVVDEDVMYDLVDEMADVFGGSDNLAVLHSQIGLYLECHRDDDSPQESPSLRIPIDGKDAARVIARHFDDDTFVALVTSLNATLKASRLLGVSAAACEHAERMIENGFSLDDV